MKKIVNRLNYRVAVVAVSAILGISTLGIESAVALDNKVKIGGVYDFTGVYYKTNGKPEQRKVSNNQREFGLDTSGHIFLDYSLVGEYGDSYGAKISLEHTTANDRSIPFFIYHEAGYGRLEVGAESSAGKKMRITGYTASSGLGNGWSIYVATTPNNPDNPKERLVAYVVNFCSFLDAKSRIPQRVDYSRKITYFTPKMSFSEGHSLQLGISYVPDSSNMGHEKIDKDRKSVPLVSVPYNFAIRDGFSYGVGYSGKFSDDIAARISFVGEKGRAVPFRKSDKKKSDIKFQHLNTYVIGGELKYNKVSFSAAYTNYNKSLTAKEVDLISRETYAYGLGVKYSLNKCNVSANYFFSSHKKSKLDVVSLGADYLVAKGLKTYFQSSVYRTDGKYLQNSIVKSNKNKGVLLALGTTISF